ncbi:MAG TPA: hypothetical protein VFZ76_04620, partial [Anaerolineales bacterium]
MRTSTTDYPIEPALEILSTRGKKLDQRLGFEDYLRRFLFLLVALGFYLFLLYPLFRGLVRSFQNRAGEFVGLANYIDYFSSTTTSTSLTNSLYISAMSTIFTVVLAFLYAYGLSRMTIPGRRILRIIAMLPIFIPSLVQALALIYIFGNNGAFTRFTGININLYGSTGIIISEAFYAFPHAFIIIAASLALADARLYEAAESLRTKGSRIFVTVTLSSVKYGLMSAAFVVFTLA